MAENKKHAKASTSGTVQVDGKSIIVLSVSDRERIKIAVKNTIAA